MTPTGDKLSAGRHSPIGEFEALWRMTMDPDSLEYTEEGVRRLASLILRLRGERDRLEMVSWKECEEEKEWRRVQENPPFQLDEQQDSRYPRLEDRLKARAVAFKMAEKFASLFGHDPWTLPKKLRPIINTTADEAAKQGKTIEQLRDDIKKIMEEGTP